MVTRIKKDKIKRIEQVEFCQFVCIKGETKTVTFTNDVLIVEEKRGYIRLSHGGVEIETIGKSTTTDYLQDDYNRTAEKYQITSDSTLLIESVIDTVELHYVQVKTPLREEKEGEIFVRCVPNEWRIKTKNNMYGDPQHPAETEFVYPSMDRETIIKTEVVMSNHAINNTSPVALIEERLEDTLPQNSKNKKKYFVVVDPHTDLDCLYERKPKFQKDEQDWSMDGFIASYATGSLTINFDIELNNIDDFAIIKLSEKDIQELESSLVQKGFRHE
jgi:hypothetical protein